LPAERLPAERLPAERLPAERLPAERLPAAQLAAAQLAAAQLAAAQLARLPVQAAGPETDRTAPEPPAIAAPVLGSAVAERAVARRAGAETDPPLLESLLRAAVAGETRARERLLAEIHPLVLRYCRARLGRQETVMGSADDVAQEVCLAVVNALPGYTLRGLSFRAFVYGIAAHKVTDAYRAIGRNRSEPVADIPDAPLVHDGPEHHLLQVELTERLGALLHLLTPRQREVLVLRIAIGLSAEETAQVVGSTPGAVRVTQHRALNRLRRKVATVGTDADDEFDDAE
jgi:RNA polymerase sigma-70 factor (ECF subfamily)